MTQEVHGKLNPELPWQNHLSTEKDSFYQQTGLKFNEALVK